MIRHTRATMTIAATAVALVLTGCTVTSPVLKSNATSAYPPAARHPGMERMEAQESATAKARAELMNQIVLLHDDGGQTLGARMVIDPTVRQEIYQSVRKYARQDNVVSTVNRTVTVFLALPEYRVTKLVNQPFYKRMW